MHIDHTNLHTTLINRLVNTQGQKQYGLQLLYATISSSPDGNFVGESFIERGTIWVIEIPSRVWEDWKEPTHKHDVVRSILASILRDIDQPLKQEDAILFRLKLDEKTPEWEDGMRIWLADSLLADLKHSLNAGALSASDHTACTQRLADLEAQLAMQEAERLLVEAQAQAAQTNYHETLQELERSHALLAWYENRRERCATYMREKALEFAAYRCMMNDEHTENLQIDRVIPGARGGKYTWDNIQVLCQLCNAMKNDHTGEGWDYRTQDFVALCQRELDRINAQESLFE